jgi:hypothetical protein
LAGAAHAGDRVYGAVFNGGSIAFAGLTGRVCENCSELGVGGTPGGLALDIADGRVHWIDQDNGGTIKYENIDGSSGVTELPTGNASISSPVGMVLDKAGGKIYWANEGNSAPCSEPPSRCSRFSRRSKPRRSSQGPRRLVSTTSKSRPVICPIVCSASFDQCLFGAPEMYQSAPLSATIIP